MSKQWTVDRNIAMKLHRGAWVTHLRRVAMECLTIYPSCRSRPQKEFYPTVSATWGT